MQITSDMVDRALTAWFKSPPSENDMGLERSMRAALEAALQEPLRCDMCGEPRDGGDHSGCDELPF